MNASLVQAPDLIANLDTALALEVLHGLDVGVGHNNLLQILHVVLDHGEEERVRLVARAGLDVLDLGLDDDVHLGLAIGSASGLLAVDDLGLEPKDSANGDGELELNLVEGKEARRLSSEDGGVRERKLAGDCQSKGWRVNDSQGLSHEEATEDVAVQVALLGEHDLDGGHLGVLHLDELLSVELVLSAGSKHEAVEVPRLLARRLLVSARYGDLNLQPACRE